MQIAFGNGQFGRSNDIGEHQCCNAAFEKLGCGAAGQKRLNVLNYLVRFIIERKVITGLDFYQPGVRNMFGHLSAGTNRDGTVVSGVKNECWGLNRGKNVPNIDLQVHSLQGRCR